MSVEGHSSLVLSIQSLSCVLRFSKPPDGLLPLTDFKKNKRFILQACQRIVFLISLTEGRAGKDVLRLSVEHLASIRTRACFPDARLPFQAVNWLLGSSFYTLHTMECDIQEGIFGQTQLKGRGGNGSMSEPRQQSTRLLVSITSCGNVNFLGSHGRQRVRRRWKRTLWEEGNGGEGQ